MFIISPEQKEALSNPGEYMSKNKDYHQQVRAFFENNASRLTSYRGSDVFRNMFYEYQMIRHYAASYMEGKESFLEIGAASGYHLFNFAPHFNVAKGADIAWYEATAPAEGALSAIETAQEIVSQTDSRVSIHVGTIDSLPEAECFEVIFSNYLLEHIPDLPLFLDECYRRLAPGGVFIATVPNGYFLLRDIVRFNLDKRSLLKVAYRKLLNGWLKIRGKTIPFRYDVTPNGWCIPNAHSEFCTSFIDQFEKRYELQNYLQPIMESGLEFVKVETPKDDTYLIIARKPEHM